MKISEKVNEANASITIEIDENHLYVNHLKEIVVKLEELEDRIIELEKRLG